MTPGFGDQCSSQLSYTPLVQITLYQAGGQNQSGSCMLDDMKITICGSMHHIENIKKAAETLRAMGYEVEIPDPRDGEVEYTTLPTEEQARLKQNLIKEHLDKIYDSDAVLIYNDEKKGIKGYIGGNTLMEMAFAYAQHLEIFLFQPTAHLDFNDEIGGMNPIHLHGDVTAVDRYFTSLPVTYVSSKSPIKLRGVSRGLRKAGIRTQVVPYPVQSDVSEQPQNIDETRLGAMNRHEKLKKAVGSKKPKYLATLESGLTPVHPEHNSFASTVVILEKIGEEPKIGINVELEYPTHMTDLVPSKYPDLGVLVQEKYGATLKDPMAYFTDGKVTRLTLLESAVFYIAAQLP